MSYKGVFDPLFSNISLKIKSLVHKSWQKPQHLRFFCTKVSACERRLRRSSDVETRMSMDYIEEPLFYFARFLFGKCCLVTFWWRMESDESGSSQNSSRRRSSSNYEEENEEFTAATDSIDHLGDCSGWEPYCDESMADTTWIVAYQARKQAESDKYTDFKQWLENKLPIENWCLICHFCFPIAGIIIHH